MYCEKLKWEQVVSESLTSGSHLPSATVCVFVVPLYLPCRNVHDSKQNSINFIHTETFLVVVFHLEEL